MKKSILLFTHEYPPFHGGVATYCQEVAKAAGSIPAEVTVWAPGPNVEGAQAPVVKRLGGRGSLQAWPLVRLFWAILWRRSEWKGQTVVLASLGAHWIFAILAGLGLTRHTTLVALFHGSEVVRAESVGWQGVLLRLLLKQASRCVAASRFTLGLLERSPFLPQGRVVELAPCAVKSALRAAAQSARELPRESTGLGEKIVILTLARLHPRKGQRDTLEALGLLPAKTRARIIYQIAGTGLESERLELERLAAMKEVPVQWCGAVSDSDLPTLYAKADLYVMSSRSFAKSVEGFGMTYLEAGIFGKPVVGYRTGGVEEAVIDGETGMLVPEADVAALSAAIQRLIEEPELRQRMGEAGRRHAESFDWEKSARILFGSTVY